LNWRQITDFAKRRPATLRLADYLGRGRGRFRVLDQINPPARALHIPDLSDWNTRDLAACWVGHATVLLRIGGMNVLTDPVMSNKVGVGLGLLTGGPRRQIAPALSIKQLPPLDLILISHAHFDHLDRPTLQRLPKNVPVITSAHTGDLIHDLGFKQVHELPWNGRTQIGDLTITAQQVRHWGARTFYDHHRGFNAYVLENGNKRVLYGGDTAYHTGFKSIGKVDLAIIGIGAYDPYVAAHATPEQAWAMADHVDADHLLPIHHSTFRLSHEPMHEPIERLKAAAGRFIDRIVAHEIGMVWAD
jgi:L-ascorbate metabolism protein UlaG (beta-lactamase superfamily)